MAAKRGMLVSRLVAVTLQEIVERETAYERARRRSIAAMEQGFDLGLCGKVTWTRDELYDLRL